MLLGSLFVLPAAAPDEGWRDYSTGNVAEAVAVWTEEAAGGDADAEFGLGVAYDLGRGVPQDESQACFHYGRAGAAGIAAAAFNTAVMLDQGRCGPRNAVRVAAWYTRAVAFGHARAEYDLAQLYEAGDGVPQNNEQAMLLYRMAASSGLTAAGEKAAALARLGKQPGAAVAAVTPLAPVDETLLDHGQPVPFAWAVPVQPGPVQLFLEVYALGQAGPHEVVARYLDQSAVSALISLAPGTTQYAWRVLTVAPEGRQYVAAEWSRFGVAGRTAP